MRKGNSYLIILFVAISSLVTTMGVFVSLFKTGFELNSFVYSCGEFLQKVQSRFAADAFLSLMFSLVMVLGVLFALVRLVSFYYSHKKLASMSDLGDFHEKLNWISEKHHIDLAVFKITDEDKLTAYTIGFIKPKIVLSRLLIEQTSLKQLEVVVLHELFHLQNKHVAWLLAARVLPALLFFVPLIAYFARQLRTEFELAADAFVVEKQKSREHICSLLALSLQKSSVIVPQIAAAPLEKRVESLLDQESSLERLRFWEVAVSLASFGLMLALVFVQPAEVRAEFGVPSAQSCLASQECETTDCVTDGSARTLFTAEVLASFQ